MRPSQRHADSCNQRWCKGPLRDTAVLLIFGALVSTPFATNTFAMDDSPEASQKMSSTPDVVHTTIPLPDVDPDLLSKMELSSVEELMQISDADFKIARGKLSQFIDKSTVIQIRGTYLYKINEPIKKAKREAEERRKREVLDAFSCFYKIGKVNADDYGNVHSFYTVFQISPDLTDEKRQQLEEMLPEYLKLKGRKPQTFDDYMESLAQIQSHAYHFLDNLKDPSFGDELRVDEDIDRL